MSTYQRRARQTQAQNNLRTGSSMEHDSTIYSENLVRKSPRIQKAVAAEGKRAISDNGRPTSMGYSPVRGREPVESPNVRRESMEAKRKRR